MDARNSASLSMPAADASAAWGKALIEAMRQARKDPASLDADTVLLGCALQMDGSVGRRNQFSRYAQSIRPSQKPLFTGSAERIAPLSRRLPGGISVLASISLPVTPVLTGSDCCLEIPFARGKLRG